MSDRRKRIIILSITLAMIVTTIIVPAKIDLTGTQTGTGGGGFSGKYTDLDFAGTTGLSDYIDNVGAGNPFNQSLNTTDVVNFTGLNIAKNTCPIITVVGEVEDAGGRIELGDGGQNDFLTLSGDNGDGIGVWTTGEELILGAMSSYRGISFYTNGTPVGFWTHDGYLAVGETNTDNIKNRLRVVGNVNVTGNVTASKFNTPSGTGWTGWIDDGTNVNCTYSGGILIAVSATSGLADYNETG